MRARLPITGAVEHPLVSVIVPAYNYARYLPEAIDSALAQDWPALEVIVVDDGSTDETPEVLAAYGDRITAIRRPNGGLNAATSTGIGAARGDFLTFLDADDTWRPDRVRLLAEALLAHPEAGLSWGDMEIVDERGNLTAPSFRARYGLPALSGRVLGRLLQGNFVSAGSMMVRASLRERFHPIPEFAAWQDWWIAVRVAEVAEIVAIPEPVNVYREHGSNMNLGADVAKVSRLFRQELPFRRWLLEHVPPSQATPRQWGVAVEMLDVAMTRAAGEAGCALPELVEITADDRRRAAAAREEARQALLGGDPALALARAAAAIGAAPDDGDARALFAQAAPLAVAQADRAQAADQTVRRDVTFALLDDLERDPQLLARYGREVGGGDDATLVVGGVDHPGAVQRLQALLAAAGMDGDDAADVLAIEARDPAGAAAAIGRAVTRRLEPARPAAA
jgi:hypothetical protein